MTTDSGIAPLPTPPAKRLDGKVAIVTGGASGIGRAISILYATHGASVVVADLTDKSTGTKETVPTHEFIVGGGGKAAYVHLDVTNEESVAAAVSKAVELFGRLDIMVNNAGLGAPFLPIWDLTTDVWTKQQAVNNTGVFYGTRAAARVMMHQTPLPTSHNGSRGWIINTSSIAGHVALPYHSAYNAAKHAVLGLTKSAATDLAPYKVHVNAICPGVTHSPMTDGFISAGTKNELTGMVDDHPFQGPGKPEDIARGALFLASDDAAWVTGTSLLVDGGYVAR